MAAAGISERPTIFGHSMFGWVAATAAMRYRERINRIVVIDSPTRDYAPEAARLRGRKHRHCRTREEILSPSRRFLHRT